MQIYGEGEKELFLQHRPIFPSPASHSSDAILAKPCWQLLQRPPAFLQPLLKADGGCSITHQLGVLVNVQYLTQTCPACSPLHCCVASGMPNLHIHLRLQPALGKLSLLIPCLASLGHRKEMQEEIFLCSLGQRHIRTQLYHLPQCKHELCALSLVAPPGVIQLRESLECPWEEAERAEGEQASDSCICSAKSADWEMKEELDQFPFALPPSCVVDGLNP